jgi:hypothetical protein
VGYIEFKKEKYMERNNLIIELDGSAVWTRRHDAGMPGGRTVRSKAILKRVVKVLEEALIQAQAELSFCPEPTDGISEIEPVTATNINRDVPIA